MKLREVNVKWPCQTQFTRRQGDLGFRVRSWTLTFTNVFCWNWHLILLVGQPYTSCKQVLGDKLASHLFYFPRGEGALPYKPIRDVPFFMVSFFSIHSWTGYQNWSEIPKQVMIIWSRTIGYCFWKFLLSNNSETEHGNAIFPKQVVEILKKWAPPRQVTFMLRKP